MSYCHQAAHGPGKFPGDFPHTSSYASSKEILSLFLEDWNPLPGDSGSPWSPCQTGLVAMETILRRRRLRPGASSSMAPLTESLRFDLVSRTRVNSDL